jgi:hypothetical protein
MADVCSTKLTFGEKATEHLANSGAASAQVRKYAKAVEPAASDLGNRRARQEALAKELGGLLK